MLKIPLSYKLDWGIFMAHHWGNILLIAGSSRNVGKTTFICQLLEQHRQQHPIAIKIAPHFHSITSGLKVIDETPNYQLFEETERSISKDSSLFLQSGAVRSFYAQAHDEHLPELFMALLPFLDGKTPILIESAALHKYVDAGLFLFIYDEQGERKNHTEANLKIADFVVHSNGKSFSVHPSQLKFENEWKITQ
ncbi:MAG TPA: hypothetical protein VKA27_13945 [Sunxiuqinia sp.]|nr:hypothetical protein [Sunxiuqinia sp.]